MAGAAVLVLVGCRGDVAEVEEDATEGGTSGASGDDAPSSDGPVSETQGRTATSGPEPTGSSGGPRPHCGDGSVDDGEACDDGNDDDTDDCLSTCAFPSCGDGFVHAGVEECDDGNDENSDACLTTCVAAACGDGFTWEGVEECDDGDEIDTDHCPTTCTLATCGDGFTWQGHEGCDDGNDDDTDDCPTTCIPATCGDGFVRAGDEECDDGNDDEHDDCLTSCVAASCGDGFIWVGMEDCDDANDVVGDGCASDCAAEDADVWVMVHSDSGELYRYSTEEDAWETLLTGAFGGDEASSNLTTDGSALYWSGLNVSDYLYRFEPSTLTLETFASPPGVQYSDKRLEWLDGRLYLFDVDWWHAEPDEGTPVHVLDGGDWTTFHLELEVDKTAVDHLAGEIYATIPNDLGFFVIDPTSQDIDREFESGTVGHLDFATYLDGYLYGRDLFPDDAPVVRFDGADGSSEETEYTPLSWLGRAAANPATHDIYFVGSREHIDEFEVYNAVSGTVTPLAAPPINDCCGRTPTLVVTFPGP